MNKLLVTTDFSVNSKAGIRFAVQMASQSSCELLFYHVIEIIKPTSWTDKQYKHFASKKISTTMERLKLFVASIYQQSGHSMNNCKYMVEIGIDVDEMVIHYAKKMKAAFICIGTRGAGKLRRLFGTNASNLMNMSSIPVIVIPKGYRAKLVETLFYASDFASVKKELSVVQKFAAPLKAAIEVYNYDYMLDVAENEIKLVKKAASLQSPGITFNFIKQNVDNPLSEHLRKDIKKIKPSVVVLFTKHNRNWFNRLFLADEPEGMAFNSKVPLLVFSK